MSKEKIPVREMIQQSVKSLGGKAKYSEIIDWVKTKYGNVNERTIRAQTIACSVNQSSRIHYPENSKIRVFDPRYDLFYSTKRGEVEFFDINKHGTWEIIEHKGKMTVARNGVPVPNSVLSLLEFLKSNPTMFQNYQAIVIKKLLENDSKFSATINEIKNKIVELNFDREDFEINSAWSTVKKVLDDHNVISINGENVKLNNENISDVEKTECLKICGDKILQHHVNKLMKKENQCYYIRPGVNGEFWKEFRTNNFVAVDYLDQNKPESAGDFDLSGLTKDEISKRKGNTDDNTELFNISQIKKGDIIAIVNNLKTIEEFAIATSDYYYKNSVNENKHRVNVEFLHFGSSKIGNPVPKGIMRDTQNKIKDFFTGDDSEYFLLRHNIDGTWKDDLGKKYHFGKTVPNQKKLRELGPGTKTIWFTKKSGEFYFWGYGSVNEIEPIQENLEWNLVYADFKYFVRNYDTSIPARGKFLKKANNSTKEKIENLPKYNIQTSMFPITKKIYDQILSQDLSHNNGGSTY